jgi:predicted amidohydrolase YtcJ
MLETVWCAVTRQTKTGRILGEEEKISVWDALKAVTINAAYQYGEEKIKGTIEAGKRADFVILDQDPLTCDPEEIRKIRVLETVKNGETVFSL